VFLSVEQVSSESAPPVPKALKAQDASGAGLGKRIYCDRPPNPSAVSLGKHALVRAESAQK